MERRRFIAGIGSAAVGGSAIVGSGAFSRVESQRQISIEVARDPDAYLGLGPCPNPWGDKPNSSYTEWDGEGHFTIEMTDDNPTKEGGQGVNSDSQSWFHNVFRIRNQGKRQVYYWIEAEPAYETDSGYGDAIQFYFDSDPTNRVDSPGEAQSLALGSQHCIGLKTVTKGLVKGDSLVEGDEIVIHADVEDPS